MPEKRVTAAQQRTIRERAHDRCEYCQSQARFATQSFSTEHIIPRSLSGETTLDNLALACQGCNNHKYTKMEARDPLSNQVVPLYHPRQQRWLEHFAWNDDFTLIIGLSPIGRASIQTLQLNREELINLRRVLFAMGEHPPTGTNE